MNVRRFERFLTSHGAPAPSLDAITRHLRGMGLLPVGGRGANAPEITAEGAALVLLALAGVANPNSAEQTARFIKKFTGAESEGRAKEGLLAVLEQMLLDRRLAAQVAEIRVCRMSTDTTIVYHNGNSETFRDESRGSGDDGVSPAAAFRVEGVLPQTLLILASLAITLPREPAES